MSTPRSQPTSVSQSSRVANAAAVKAPFWRSVLRGLIWVFRFPETITVILLAAAFVAGANLSPYFLDVQNLLDSTSDYMEVGIIALAMTFIIISGNIDLSVASNLALTAVVCAKLHADGLPMTIAAPLAPVLGGLLGAFNGLLVTRLRLPSLVVTLGTLALYRGVAQMIAGDHSIGDLPEAFVGIDYRKFGLLPLPLILFLILAVVFGVVLKKSVFGRCVHAVGTNEMAARFSGMRTRRVKLAVFALSGMMAGIGAMMMLSRLSVARYNMANGDELAVITAVVLGGTDIFGGRGSIFGTVTAIFLLGVIRKGMGLANLTAENQLAITGSLLIAAVLLTRAVDALGQKLDMKLRGTTDA